MKNPLLSDIDWSCIKYSITKFVITKNKKELTTVMSGQVRNIYIEKNFDDDALPIFLIKIALNEDVYYDIINNPSDIIFNIKISGYREKESGEKTNQFTYLSGNFVPLGVDGTPFVNKNLYKKTKENATFGDGGMSMQDFSGGHTFILGKKELIQKTGKIQNTVISRGDMTNIVSYILTSCGFSNVLMTPFDNKSVYSEVIILPLTVIKQLSFLNSFFGFYKHGAMIFFDFDRIYILRNNAECSAYEKNEIKTINFLIFKNGSGDDLAKGSYIEEKAKCAYINSGTEQFHVSNLSNATDNYYGSSSMIINSDGSTSIADNGSGSGTFNVISTVSHNSYYSHEVKLRMKEMKGVVSITCTNIDLRLLTPNKYYKILSDEIVVTKETNHPYRISSYVSVFNIDGDGFSAITNVTLKRTEA